MPSTNQILTFAECAEKVNCSVLVRSYKQEVIHLAHEEFLFLSGAWDELRFHGTIIKRAEQCGKNATLADTLCLQVIMIANLKVIRRYYLYCGVPGPPCLS